LYTWVSNVKPLTQSQTQAEWASTTGFIKDTLFPADLKQFDQKYRTCTHFNAHLLAPPMLVFSPPWYISIAPLIHKHSNISIVLASIPGETITCTTLQYRFAISEEVGVQNRMANLRLSNSQYFPTVKRQLTASPWGSPHLLSTFKVLF